MDKYAITVIKFTMKPSNVKTLIDLANVKIVTAL
jgi:hypothetical protein